MSFPVKHCKKCLASFPRCPCNTCAKDVIYDDGSVCCSKKRKKCEEERCPDQAAESEVEET